ncbi:MAG: Calx-beta domain-containing protein [Kineosporiaceae bacterium]
MRTPVLIACMTAALLGAAVLPTSAVSDTSAPEVVSLSVSATSVDVEDGDGKVTVTAAITDDLSGLDYASVYWWHPSAPESWVAVGLWDARRVSGTANDGIYTDDLVFPQYARSGTWFLQRIVLRDKAKNERSLSAQEIADSGLARAIEVYSGGSAPTAPTGVNAVPGDRIATVTWQAPATPGVPPVDSYRVVASPGGASSIVGRVAPGVAPPTTAAVEGLENGVAYTFTVTAVNTVGSSPASTPSAAISPRPWITVTGGTASESSRSLGFTAALSAPSARPVTVTLKAGGGTAKATLDYTPTTKKVTFPPGATSIPVTVEVLDDALHEKAETMNVTASTPIDAALLAPGRAIGTIVDNDPVPTLFVSTPSVAEGTLGSTTMSFAVTLRPVSGAPSTVTYKTKGGTATPGVDYTPTSGTLTLAPGQTSGTITVPVIPDSLDEPDETVVLLLSAPKEVQLSTTSVTGTITDDDAGPTADLAVMLDHSTGIFVGDDLVIRVWITNNGPAPAAASYHLRLQGPVLLPGVDTGNSTVSATCTAGEIDALMQESCSTEPIEPGRKVLIEHSWSAINPGQLVADVQVTGNIPDSVPTNNRSVSQATVSGPQCSIVGTNGADTLVGTAGADVICGLGGDDVIDGQSGDDYLLGGTGTDTATFAAAPAAVNADLTAGTATGWGWDALAGIENVTGSRYADRLKGDAGANQLSGMGGADQVTGAAGADVLLGGDGSDRLDAVDGVSGNDRVDGGNGTADVCSADSGDWVVACP